MKPSGGLSPEESAAAAAFSAAERHIALLDRCTPENARAERARLARVYGSADVSTSPFERRARWVLSRAPALDEVKRLLRSVLPALQSDALYPFYADRCEELLLEAELVESRGTPAFRELARLRYRLEPSDLAAANELAAGWLEGSPGAEVPLRDAARREAGVELAAALRARLDALGLDVPVVERDNLATAAAVGDSVVYVSGDVTRDPDVVARIVLHEIEGHLLPRHSAKSAPCALLSIGARGAGEDEEGRALLLEERAGFLSDGAAAGPARRRELALRHLAAVAVRDGAELEDVMQLLTARGMSVAPAVRLAERVVRGGGLGREVAYLPALLRVRRAFSAEPELEEWFRRGRVSIAAARALSHAGA